MKLATLDELEAEAAALEAALQRREAINATARLRGDLDRMPAEAPVYAEQATS